MPKNKTKLGTEQAPADAARRFLEFYYPIHYKAGLRGEDSMRGGEIGRHQVAILWLIHSEGTGGRQMNRKDIERQLGAWFEISGAAITKAIRTMASAPLSLLTVEEAAHSGREKVVTLTRTGEKFVDGMISRGDAFIQRIIETMTDEEINQGLPFFQRISDVLDDLR